MPSHTLVCDCACNAQPCIHVCSAREANPDPASLQLRTSTNFAHCAAMIAAANASHRPSSPFRRRRRPWLPPPNLPTLPCIWCFLGPRAEHCQVGSVPHGWTPPNAGPQAHPKQRLTLNPLSSESATEGGVPCRLRAAPFHRPPIADPGMDPAHTNATTHLRRHARLQRNQAPWSRETMTGEAPGERGGSTASPGTGRSTGRSPWSGLRSGAWVGGVSRRTGHSGPQLGPTPRRCLLLKRL